MLGVAAACQFPTGKRRPLVVGPVHARRSFRLAHCQQGRDFDARVGFCVVAGLTAELWSFTAELGTVHAGFGSPDSLVGDTFSVVGLAAHYHGDPASPYFMFSMPVDHRLAGKIVALTVGVAF